MLWSVSGRNRPERDGKPLPGWTRRWAGHEALRLSTYISCEYYEGNVILGSLGLDGLIVPGKFVDVEYGGGYFFQEGTGDKYAHARYGMFKVATKGGLIGSCYLVGLCGEDKQLIK